jgi:hypothetical protein
MFLVYNDLPSCYALLNFMFIFHAYACNFTPDDNYIDYIVVFLSAYIFGLYLDGKYSNSSEIPKILYGIEHSHSIRINFSVGIITLFFF